MADIFISSKAERRDAVRHVAKILRRHDFSVWYDYRLVAGKDWEPLIIQEINAARVVLTLWCDLAAQSQGVVKEATAAAGVHKYLPCKMQDIALPEPLAAIDALDLSNWDGNPRSPALLPLLTHIGQRALRPPRPDFIELMELEEDWRSAGKLSWADFGLTDLLPTEH